MQKSYLKYYLEKSYLAPIKFFGDYFLEQEPRKRLALWNRLKDYVGILMAGDDGGKVLEFHHDINQILLEQSEKFPHYDYGEGYFYQDFPEALISGFRDTTSRVDQLGLMELVRNKSVLDVGCNAGFLLLHLADSCERGFGFDVNPFLVKVANATKSFRNIKNINFATTAFEKLELKSSYDVCLSLANHSTYDQNTKQDVESYFARIALALDNAGLLIFESHPPAIEDKDKLNKTIRAIEKYFTIKEKKLLPFSGFLDRDRTYILATKSSY
jgi:SAM-dependent methyltransferase